MTLGFNSTGMVHALGPVFLLLGISPTEVIAKGPTTSLSTDGEKLEITLV